MNGMVGEVPTRGGSVISASLKILKPVSLYMRHSSSGWDGNKNTAVTLEFLWTD